MRNFCLLSFCVVFFVLPAHAQKKKKNLPAEAKVNVPNCVWIDTLELFADQTEVANIHWKEYCAWIQKNEPDKYQACLPDTAVWYDIYEYADVYVANNYSYLGFQYFPVVGITKQQAEEYTQWRSKMVTEAYNQQQKGLARKYQVEIIYRLPAEKEWAMLASSPLRKTYNSRNFKKYWAKISKKQQKEMQNEWSNEIANCKMPYDSAKYHENMIKSHRGYFIDKTSLYRISNYIFAYFPNEYNLYNTIGNVAEMVQEEGIAKGGSWFHTLEELAIKERQIYTKSTAWLGFRCVATVKLTPKEKAGKTK